MANFRKSIADVQGSAKAAVAILEGAEGAVEQVTRCCCCSYLKPSPPYDFQHTNPTPARQRVSQAENRNVSRCLPVEGRLQLR